MLSSRTGLHSAALIDKQQYEETQRASTASRAFLTTPAPAQAPDPLTGGFLGSDLIGKLFRRPSQERSSSVQPQSRCPSNTSRRGSFSLSQDLRLVSLLDPEQVRSSRGSRERSRRYSLVSSLDTTQTREASSSSSYRERREKPPELGELNTLQQAIPVARAAARFRSAISEEDSDLRERGRRRRKSHSLY